MRSALHYATASRYLSYGWRNASYNFSTGPLSCLLRYEPRSKSVAGV